ncbi:enoyl-CoA hydratase/isomerase family protein, partial [Streptomyces sp. SID10244]|nr:enoyl-CoA hydratase/isomerase family protein [Streptomyces sp. SID10244]
MDLDALTTVIGELDDHVLTLTLNRPERLNSFTDTMRTEFRQIWDHAREQDDIHVVVLRAAGDRAFSTGMDTREGTFISDNVFSRRDPGNDLSPKHNGCW